MENTINEADKKQHTGNEWQINNTIIIQFCQWFRLRVTLYPYGDTKEPLEKKNV